MFDDIAMLRMATGLAAHSGTRQAIIAQNVANADTPGYRGRDAEPFEGHMERGDHRMRATRPGHITDGAAETGRVRTYTLDATADPNGNTVSVESEMMRAADAFRRHEMAVTIYRSGLDVMRSTLGRR